MNCPFLLESNLKWNPLIQTFPIHYTSFKPTNHFIKHNLKFTQTPKFHIKCSSSPSSFNDLSTRGVLKSLNKQNPVQILAQTIIKALKSLQKPAITAVLLGFLLLSDPNNALAASGGRMGGKSFSRPSMSSSRSYSTPRMDSGRSFSSAPYFGPSPFGGGGFYVGPAVGIGSSFFFIMAGFAAFVLVSGFLSDRSDDGLLTATEKTSVLKLQVGLLGMARSLQQDLNRIAERADTSTPEGLSYVLTETMLALLRHPDFCISAYSSVDVKRSMDEGEKRFNQLSIEERGKFDEETLVNVNNIKKQSATSRRANGFSNEYIVITILVAAEGVHKLPSINNSGDLKEALQVLASIPSSRTLAVEVLWTPQNEDDTLSERELLEDYSLLRPL
ncbi:Myelin-associated oligodendrocyte basic protein [Heracleum sosnowskyi]|uniref:Myelin-associated oligodendrocyte basic protein n=1 Tax=Heracleum sosnowskyi TaxID=360622 RepID=A0AAD8HWR0_9APIA|nr:Myelin-associated oligodendrocyte basic protein [Heracleum sosnowskyi]